MTPAGRAAGESRLPWVAGRFYLPMDWRGAVGAVLRRIRPSMLLIVETELWPNLLRATADFGAHIVLVNARLSSRSFRRYRLLRSLMRQVLEPVHVICAQTEADAGRFRDLGARSDRIFLCGNLKFDSEPPRLASFPPLLRKAAEQAARGPLLIAASTMVGEERLVLQAWTKIREQFPNALMILVPRHPARFGEVVQILSASAGTYIRRTQLAAQEPDLARQLVAPQVILLDTIGELTGILEVADVVFVGGSLVPTGGHNILEPAYWAKPVVFGPHMENFQDIARLFLEANACIQVQTANELAMAVLTLFRDRAAAEQLGGRAKKVLQEQTGATERVLRRIQGLLNDTTTEAQ